MREICLKTPGISIEFKVLIMVNEKEKKFVHTFDPMEAWPESNIPWSRMQKMLVFPFHFVVSGLFFHSGQNVSLALIKKTKDFMEKMGVKKVYLLAISTRRAEWKDLILLAKVSKCREDFE